MNEETPPEEPRKRRPAVADSLRESKRRRRADGEAPTDSGGEPLPPNAPGGSYPDEPQPG